MKIAPSRHSGLHPVDIDIVGVRKSAGLSMCLVKVETDTGLTGWGMTAITEEEVIAEIVNRVAAPNLIGEDPLAYERLWHKLYWLLSPRGQTGYASHAIAAIDTALWDIMGQHRGEPVWRLLGGARDQVPLYATFGFSFLDREHLAEAAKLWVSQGFKRLKMTVGDSALKLAGRERPIEAVLTEDIARIQAVREAVGPDVALYIDANCNLDLYHAAWLAKRIEDLGVAVFEEPITQNDVPSMVQLRQRTSIPLSCGQNEGLMLPLPRPAHGAGGRHRPAQRGHQRRLYAVRQDRRHGGGVQRSVRQRRRVALPQHAYPCRPRQWRPGRTSLSGGRVLPGGLHRTSPSRRTAICDFPITRPWLRARPECAQRIDQAPDIRRKRQGLTFLRRKPRRGRNGIRRACTGNRATVRPSAPDAACPESKIPGKANGGERRRLHHAGSPPKSGSDCRPGHTSAMGQKRKNSTYLQSGRFSRNGRRRQSNSGQTKTPSPKELSLWNRCDERYGAVLDGTGETINIIKELRASPSHPYKRRALMLTQPSIRESVSRRTPRPAARRVDR